MGVDLNRQLAGLIKLCIVWDIDAEVIPETVASLEEVQQYTPLQDFYAFIELETDEVPETQDRQEIEAEVDAWLKAGRPEG